MTAIRRPPPLARPATRRTDRMEWLVSTDHKRIGLLTIGTGLVLFYAFGALAMTMRTQLARPDQHILSNQEYNQIFTLHGTGMIALVVTPIALGLGVYLVPLMIGAPTIAAPRATLLGYWLYVGGALAVILGCAVPGGAASGWWSYIPLANGMYSPGTGQNMATFAGRRFFGYKGTVLALLVFAAGSMAVWGHHMFTTGQVTTPPNTRCRGSAATRRCWTSASGPAGSKCREDHLHRGPGRRPVGVFNFAFVCVLIGMGEQPVVIAIYASAAALVEIIAALVWLGARRQERRTRWRQAPNGDSIVIFAAGVVLAAIGACFYPYVALLAIAPLVMAALTELSDGDG
jgi:Cytochrome C and Quinol oxidase polypeptide I